MKWFAISGGIVCTLGLATFLFIHEQNRRDEIVKEKVKADEAAAQQATTDRQREAYRVAINRVFQQREEARAKPMSPAKYFKAISTFDVSECPPDFKEAWIGYVEARRRLADPLAGFKQASHGAEMMVAEKTGSKSAADDAVRRMQANDSTGWFESMQRIAIKYGVTPPTK